MSRKQMVGGLLGAVVSLFGCTAKPEEPQIVERTEIDGDRILIAYYSWGGNTRAAAEAMRGPVPKTLSTGRTIVCASAARTMHSATSGTEYPFTQTSTRSKRPRHSPEVQAVRYGRGAAPSAAGIRDRDPLWK